MNDRLRILHTESSMGWGGQECRILTESAGMISRGHKVIIACQPGSAIADRAGQYGVETRLIRMKRAGDHTAIRRLIALIRGESIHILNTHSSIDSWCGGIAAKFCAAKCIRTRHLSISIKNTLDSRILYKSLPDAVVTTGEMIREHIAIATGTPLERIISIPTGIDLQRFDPSQISGQKIREEIGIPVGVPLVGTIGMMRGMKGHVHFVRAAASVIETMPGVRFLLVGDAPDGGTNIVKDTIINEIHSLAIADKITLAGYRTDIPELLAAMDVFVLASVKDEGVPQVISQAMAMGKPVVATNVGGIPEQVIDSVTGYLVEKANADQIADAVLRILASPEDAARMGEEGRIHAERNFSIEGMLDRTEALYERLIESRRSE